MKFYRVSYYHADEGMMLIWHASNAAAQTQLLDMIEDCGKPQGPAHVEVVHIDTRRAGLLRWLNTHFTRDNG